MGSKGTKEPKYKRESKNELIKINYYERIKNRENESLSSPEINKVSLPNVTNETSWLCGYVD